MCVSMTFTDSSYLSFLTTISCCHKNRFWEISRPLFLKKIRVCPTDPVHCYLKLRLWTKGHDFLKLGSLWPPNYPPSFAIPTFQGAKISEGHEPPSRRLNSFCKLAVIELLCCIKSICPTHDCCRWWPRPEKPPAGAADTSCWRWWRRTAAGLREMCFLPPAQPPFKHSDALPAGLYDP